MTEEARKEKSTNIRSNVRASAKRSHLEAVARELRLGERVGHVLRRSVAGISDRGALG
jgi:hypothetical protein